MFFNTDFVLVIFRCLLDVMSVALVDMDIYSAEYVKEKDYKPSADPTSDLIFSSFVVVRQVGSLASSLRQTQTHITQLQDKPNNQCKGSITLHESESENFLLSLSLPNINT